MDKYGFLKYWDIRKAARQVSGDVLGRVLPHHEEDRTLVMDADIYGNGIEGTREQVAQTRLRQRVELMKSETTTGSIAGSVAQLTGADPRKVRAIQQMFDSLEGMAVASGRSTRPIARSPTNTSGNLPSPRNVVRDPRRAPSKTRTSPSRRSALTKRSAPKACPPIPKWRERRSRRWTTSLRR